MIITLICSAIIILYDMLFARPIFDDLRTVAHIGDGNKIRMLIA